MVPALDEAAMIISKAEIFIVVGTSLAVYPSAGLVDYAPRESEKYIIDPAAIEINGFTAIREKASVGIPALVEKLLKSSGY